MGTTVVGAWIRQQIVSIAHVGDSRAYLWHDHRLEPLTRDHSLGEFQIAAGLIEEVRRLPVEHQNALVRVLGREPDVEVDLREVPVQQGDYVLLCSDGLTRMVPEYMLAKAFHQFREPQRICDFLIDAANSNGGADNITVVVVEVTGGWWRRLMSMANVMSGTSRTSEERRVRL
jgi:protein phosphatase